MPTDTDLFRLRHTEYRHIQDDARAAEVIAARFSHDPNSVRGRLSRASTPNNLLWLAENIAKNPPTKSPSVARQEQTFQHNRRALSGQMQKVHRYGGYLVGLFDMHYPFTRFDALDLGLQIISDLKPHYVLHGGDMNDNEGRGRWEDNRSAYDMLFSADYANQRTGELAIYKAIKQVAPFAIQPVANGNHDIWRFNDLRAQAPMEAEDRIADYVETLAAQGVHIYSTTREEPVRLSSSLLAWHGQFTSSNHALNARATLGQFMDDGQAVSTVSGHTHRPAHVPGGQVGYSGVDFWNAPCLSRIERLPWLKRDPRGWGLGIFVAQFEERGIYGQNILFEPRGRSLIARLDGRVYETELKDK